MRRGSHRLDGGMDHRQSVSMGQPVDCRMRRFDAATENRRRPLRSEPDSSANAASAGWAHPDDRENRYAERLRSLRDFRREPNPTFIPVDSLLSCITATRNTRGEISLSNASRLAMTSGWRTQRAPSRFHRPAQGLHQAVLAGNCEKSMTIGTFRVRRLASTAMPFPLITRTSTGIPMSSR